MCPQVVVDHFTKYMSAKSFVAKSAKEVAAFVKKIFKGEKRRIEIGRYIIVSKYFYVAL